MRKIKELIKDILYCLTSLAPHRQGVAVLMYHSVDNNPIDFNVKPNEFFRQMAYLHKKNYKIISVEELVEILESGRSFNKKTVVLTFDDGFKDNYTSVFPLLKKYNFKATIFITTSFIGKQINNSYNLPLDVLSWEQIKEMHNSGLVDFQPHSATHPKLAQISEKELEKEIKESKEILEKELSKKCYFSAYPKGNYNNKVIEEFKKQNFKAVFTIHPGLIRVGDSAFELKRNFINSSPFFSRFRSITKGIILKKWWKKIK